MENAGYLFAAYTIIWAVIFGYVFFLVRRQAHVNKEIDSLKGRAPGNNKPPSPE